MTDTARLTKLGLTSAAQWVEHLREQSRKLTLAYEHFRYVRQEKVDAFNRRLQQYTLKDYSTHREFKQLTFIPLHLYTEIPPEAVLDALEQAIVLECFDRFEIAKIESVTQTKDPILFGCITGCTDRFFIAQWDDDVRIEQLLTPTEG